MTTITIMRYEGNGQHEQWDRYKEGENTMHESSTVYTEEQLSDYGRGSCRRPCSVLLQFNPLREEKV